MEEISFDYSWADRLEEKTVENAQVHIVTHRNSNLVVVHANEFLTLKTQKSRKSFLLIKILITKTSVVAVTACFVP